MKKYLLSGFYLLVMLAIYHHPIILPNEGPSIPTGSAPKSTPTNSPEAKSEVYALETTTQKSASDKGKHRFPAKKLISQNEQ